jgi:hypothetical protein
MTMTHENTPNEETRKELDETDKGIGLIPDKSVSDLFEKQK